MHLPLDCKSLRRRRAADRALDGALTAVAWTIATGLLLLYAWGAWP